eukprot:2887005-Karenia_brevis.AAC.1
MAQSTTGRLIHIITGDAVNTNQNACRRLWQHAVALASEYQINYGLVVLICSSHQANLVVQ